MDIRVLDGGVLRRPWVRVHLGIGTGFVLSAEWPEAFDRSIAAVRLSSAQDVPRLTLPRGGVPWRVQPWSGAPRAGRVARRRKARSRTT